MERLRRAGLHREEHGDVAEIRGRAAEPGHQRSSLGAAHAGHAGQGAAVMKGRGWWVCGLVASRVCCRLLM